jgi:hypothetical protein
MTRVVIGVLFILFGSFAGIGALINLTENGITDIAATAGGVVIFSIIPIWFGVNLIQRFQRLKKMRG